MPDLRKTRKNITTALAIMLGLDVVAVIVLLSPLVGSTESRRQQLNQLWTELQIKTRQVEPLKNLDKKVVLANKEIGDFYKTRFPSQDSQVFTTLGKLASANGVTIEQVRQKPLDEAVSNVRPVELEADLSGNYVSLAKFINALERDDTFFLIRSITLGGEPKGPLKLQMKLETYLKGAA
jgi:Tfp pilus assembly protein PilO